MSQFGNDSVPSISSDFNTSGDPPAWPKAVGIFSIVWGSLGIPCSGCMSIMTLGGAGLYEWGRQKQIAANMPDTGPMPAAFQPGPVEVVSSIVWLIGVVVLLIAGIQVVRRRAAGRTTHLVYAAISILGTVVYGVSAVIKSRAIAEWIAHNPGDPYLKQPGVSMAANTIMPIVVSVILLAYPAFIFLWFGVMGKRPEGGAIPQEPLV
jgi:hypothetical protein